MANGEWRARSYGASVIAHVSRITSRHPKLVAAFLLWLLFAQAMTSIPHLSITFDEPVHIATGYSILRTGDFRLVEDHPPLLEMWMSLPLLLSPQLPNPASVSTWELGDRRLFAHHEVWWNLPIDTWLTPPRIMIVFLGVILAALIFRWAADWFGPRGGLLALGLCVFDPNILSHARLATLDLGVTLAIVLTLYTLQRALKHPSYIKLGSVGLVLGLALASKISTAILLPITGIQLLVWGLPRWKLKRWLGYGCAYFGSALLGLWAIHLFQIGHIAGIPFAVPAPTYLRAFFRIGQHVVGENRRAYLLGQTYIGGHWAYFPVALLLKTPLPVLLLLGIAAVTFRLRQGWTKSAKLITKLGLWLILFPAVYLVISMMGEINIGYRHILPIVPFFYLMIAYWSVQPRQTPIASRRSAWLLLLLIGWQVLGTIRIWPFHLTYFNELVGGPNNGYRYLADSNVDWGQGLKAVKTYLEKRPLKDVKLSHFAYFLQPEQIYGLTTTPLPPASNAPAVLPQRYNPEPGTYILSASSLRGLQGVDSEMYNWFWHREPDAIIANSMLVYMITAPDPPRTWIAQCTDPVTPLSSEAIDGGFGQNPWRRLNFDCRHGWIYPASGAAPGWLVLSGHLFTAQSLLQTARSQPPQTTDAFINRHLINARLSYQQKHATHLSPYTIYESPTDLKFTPTATYPALAENPPTIQNIPATASPVRFNEHLTFLQSLAYIDNSTLDIETWWRIDAEPGIRPLSIMAHLLTPTGETIGVADGLSVPIILWETGDIIVQRHSFTVPTAQARDTYLLRTGIYWLDTGERWAINGHPNADALFIPIPYN